MGPDSGIALFIPICKPFEHHHHHHYIISPPLPPLPPPPSPPQQQQQRNHQRLNMGPDGGIARIRVHGEVSHSAHDHVSIGKEVDLAAVEFGE
jgi:allantoicase